MTSRDRIVRVVGPLGSTNEMLPVSSNGSTSRDVDNARGNRLGPRGVAYDCIAIDIFNRLYPRYVSRRIHGR